MKKSNDTSLYQRRRKLVSIVSLLLFLAVLVLITLLFTRIFAPYMQSKE